MREPAHSARMFDSKRPKISSCSALANSPSRAMTSDSLNQSDCSAACRERTLRRRRRAHAPARLSQAVDVASSRTGRARQHRCASRAAQLSAPGHRGGTQTSPDRRQAGDRARRADLCGTVASQSCGAHGANAERGCRSWGLNLLATRVRFLSVLARCHAAHSSADVPDASCDGPRHGRVGS